jgi:hypothetical protein
MATSRSDFHSRPEYVKGDTSQRLCADFLMSRGWYVIPSYDFTAEETKAPRMQGTRDSFVLPDLDVSKSACRRWVEVKYKRSATWTRKTRRLEHGIDTRLYSHYLRVEAETGCELWIAVHEGVTEKLLARRVSDLSPHIRTWEGNSQSDNRGYRKSMTYFPRSEFQHLATIPIPSPAQGIKEMRSIVASYPRNVREHLATGHSRLFPNEVAMLHRYPDDARTLLTDLEQLPWFNVDG